MINIFTLFALMINTAPIDNKGVDLSNYIEPGESSLCQLSDAGEDMFKRAYKTKRTGKLALPDGPAATIALTRKQLGGEAVNTTLRIQMPPGTVWQGLPLAYIEQSDVQIPESHGATTRELAVYASLSTFRDTLTRLKQDAPAFPDGKQVEYPGYGATVQTEQRGSLAILRCVSND